MDPSTAPPRGFGERGGGSACISRVWECGVSACRVQEGVSLSYNLHLAREEMPHTHPVLQSEFLKFPFFQAPPRAAPTPRRSPRRKREGKEGGRHADDWQKLRLKSDGRRRGMGGRGSGKQDGTGWGKKTKTELSGPFLLFPRSPPGLISASIRDSAQVGCLHARRSMQVEEKPQRSSSLAEDHNLRRSWREKILKKKIYRALPRDLDPNVRYRREKSTGGCEVHSWWRLSRFPLGRARRPAIPPRRNR